MVLEIDALPASIGRHQDAQRVAGRVGVEGRLDHLAALLADAPVEGHDPVLGQVGVGDGRLEQLHQVPLGVRVLGEDEHAAVVPAGVSCSQVRAEVFLDPGDQVPDPAVRLIPSLVGDASHLVEQRELGTHCLGRAA